MKKPARSGGLASIAGDRVHLRPPRPGDFADWVRLRRENRNYLRLAEPAVPRGFDPYGAEAFERLLVSASTERTRRFFVCDNETKALLGQVSLSDISRGPFQSCFAGYWIGRRHSNKGLMSEALALAIRYAFEELKLHRVEANIRPENLASRAVAAKCGLRCEGVALRLLKLAGQWRDHERWAITLEDLGRRRRPAGVVRNRKGPASTNARHTSTSR